MNCGMNADKALCERGRLEALYYAFPSLHGCPYRKLALSTAVEQATNYGLGHDPTKPYDDNVSGKAPTPG